MPDFWNLTLSGARPGQGQREEVGNFQMSLLGHFTPPSTDEAGNSDGDGSAELHSLGQALEQLTYLALERHHPGWEINDGACGELVIDVAEATFVLDCSLRFTATDDHRTEL